jgi:hypothetical protein
LLKVKLKVKILHCLEKPCSREQLWLLWPWSQPCFEVGDSLKVIVAPATMGKVSHLTLHVDGTLKLQLAVETRGRRAPEGGLVEQFSPT